MVDIFRVAEAQGLKLSNLSYADVYLSAEIITACKAEKEFIGPSNWKLNYDFVGEYCLNSKISRQIYRGLPDKLKKVVLSMTRDSYDDTTAVLRNLSDEELILLGPIMFDADTYHRKWVAVYIVRGLPWPQIDGKDIRDGIKHYLDVNYLSAMIVLDRDYPWFHNRLKSVVRNLFILYNVDSDLSILPPELLYEIINYMRII